MVGQANVEKYATGCDGLSLSITSVFKNSLITVQNGDDRKGNTSTKGDSKKMNCNIYIATINLRSRHDDIKLETEIKATNNLGTDILAIQESRRISSGLITLEDDLIKGWQLVYPGDKHKHEHGVPTTLSTTCKN